MLPVQIGHIASCGGKLQPPISAVGKTTTGMGLAYHTHRHSHAQNPYTQTSDAMRNDTGTAHKIICEVNRE